MDDRDVRRRIAPPMGVRVQTSPPEAESFDEETPIEGDPVAQINTRAKSAASNSKAAFSLIREVQRESRAAVEQDQKDHARIYTTLDNLTETINEVNSHVGNLREGMGEVSGQLTVLTTGIADERRARLDHDKIELIAKTEITTRRELAEIDDTSEGRKFRRKTIYKVVATVVTAIGALAAAYAAGLSG